MVPSVESNDFASLYYDNVSYFASSESDTDLERPNVGSQFLECCCAYREDTIWEDALEMEERCAELRCLAGLRWTFCVMEDFAKVFDLLKHYGTKRPRRWAGDSWCKCGAHVEQFWPAHVRARSSVYAHHCTQMERCWQVGTLVRAFLFLHGRLSRSVGLYCVLFCFSRRQDQLKQGYRRSSSPMLSVLE